MSENNHTSNGQMQVGFLGHLDFENGSAYRGAILVTDAWGKPLEFRCTAPVKPNQVQRTLYGQTLMPHILVELLASPLLQSCQAKPEVILVQEASFFDVRHRFEAPVVLLRRQGAGVNVRSDGDEELHKPIVVASESGKFDPIVVESHWQFPGDLQSCCDRVRELFGRWDLMEPFERLNKGLEYVHQQKVLAS
jgi:hypothetical protein